MAMHNSLKKLKPSAHEDVNKSAEAHIPFTLRDSVLMLSSTQAYVGNLPTIFVGIVDEDYPEAMWMKHATRLSRLFNFEMDFAYDIKVNGAGSQTIDAEQMGQDMSNAIDLINNTMQQHNFESIRIIGMGVHSATGVHDALESLVKGWNLQWDKKKVQFVALGDSMQSSYLNFCKALCLKKICAAVQFYKTMDYDQFGYFQDDPIRRLGAQLLAGVHIEEQNTSTSK